MPENNKHAFREYLMNFHHSFNSHPSHLEEHGPLELSMVIEMFCESLLFKMVVTSHMCDGALKDD